METEKLKPAGHPIYKDSTGKRVPGATTIIGVLAKPQLIVWANRMGLEGIDTTKYVDNLADVGTLAHFLILCRFKDAVPDLSDFTENQIMMASSSLLSFETWLGNHTIEPLFIEEPVVSDSLKFGGVPDLFCNLDDVPTLVDFKTGRSLYIEVILQLAAYAYLLSELGFSTERAIALRIGREAGEGFEVLEVSQEALKDGFAAFTSCLNLYRQMQELGKNHWRK